MGKGKGAFERFKSSVNRGITTIGAKTSSTLEKSKVKLRMDNLEREIGSIYGEIGKKTYEIWESQSGELVNFDDKFQAIKEKKAEIENLHKEIEEIDEKEKELLGTVKKKEEEVETVEKVEVVETVEVVEKVVEEVEKEE